jgi:hypothetical protein
MTDSKQLEKELKQLMYALMNKKHFDDASLVKEGFQMLMEQRHELNRLGVILNCVDPDGECRAMYDEDPEAFD